MATAASTIDTDRPTRPAATMDQDNDDDGQSIVTKARKRIVEFNNNYTAGRAGGQVLANPDDEMGIIREVQIVGMAVITIAIVAIVANAVMTTNSINNTTGPFASVIDKLNTTGTSAMGLLVVGLIVVAGRAIMSYMGVRGGGGGGGF